MSDARFCPRCGVPFGEQATDHQRCAACDYVLFRDPKVAVAAVIEFGEGILLVRRAIDPGMGLWSFPAGFVDRGEVLEEALRREVWEELGLDVDVDGLIGVYSVQGNPVVLVVYSATIRSDSPSLVIGDENSDARGFDLDRFPEMAFSHDRQIVSDWLRRRKSAEEAR